MLPSLETYLGPQPFRVSATPNSKTSTAPKTKAERRSVVIDHKYFPHIMDTIITSAPPESLVVLSRTSRKCWERVGFATHVAMSPRVVKGPWANLPDLRFHSPGGTELPFPHMGTNGFSAPRVTWDTLAEWQPGVAEAFRRFRFVDVRRDGMSETDLSLPRAMRPDYVRIQGMCPVLELSRAAKYTVLVGQQQDLSDYPTRLLRPCRCATASITVVLSSVPAESVVSSGAETNTPKCWHYALHFVGPNAREDSRLGTASARRAWPVHPKVAVGNLCDGTDLYPRDLTELGWMQKLAEHTTTLSYLSLEEYAAGRGLSQAEITFERGVLHDVDMPAPTTFTSVVSSYCCVC